MNPTAILESLTFCGRTFSAPELELMRQTAVEFSALGVTEISRTVCELLEWKRPSGKLKNHECRQLLERLQEHGWLPLPPLRRLGPHGPRGRPPSRREEPPEPIRGSAADCEPIELTLVEAASADSIQWRAWMAAYHYLGYRVPVGANLRYLVRSPVGDLACVQWSSPAWKMAARDHWIGWNHEQRKRNLQYIVNHSRFLILPWVRVAGLASKILAHCARQLPADWERLYGYRPLLLETLVDAHRFAGTCYRAANWIPLGQTQGRGRMDRCHQLHGKAPKLIYVYPLCRQVQQRLRSASPPAFSPSDDD